MTIDPADIGPVFIDDSSTPPPANPADSFAATDVPLADLSSQQEAVLATSPLASDQDPELSGAMDY